MNDKQYDGFASPSNIGPDIVVTVRVGKDCSVMHPHVVAHSSLMFVNKGVEGSQLLPSTAAS